jgi:hypothetical protein
MKALFHLRAIKRYTKIAVFLVSLASTSAIPGSIFEKLLADPQLFDGKRVILVGIASVGGSGIYLYRNEHEAQNVGVTVLIAWNRNSTDYSKLNNRWVKVTGIVDAKRHGAFNSYPCEISPERLELLPRPPVKESNIRSLR